MEIKEKAKLENERINDLRNCAKMYSNEEGIPYDEAYNKARNFKGVSDVKDIAEANYGTASFEYTETLGNIGATINGKDVATISPEKLIALNAAKNIGADVNELTADISVDEIRKNAVKHRSDMEKTKKKDIQFILERKDTNAA